MTSEFKKITLQSGSHGKIYTVLVYIPIIKKKKIIVMMLEVLHNICVKVHSICVNRCVIFPPNESEKKI